MRLLIASPDPYLPEVRGGGQLAIRDQCTYLRRLGVEVLVLAGGAGEASWEEQPVVRAPDPARRLAAVAAAFRPDMVLIQVGAIGPMVRAAQAIGLPTAALLHNSRIEGDLVLTGVPLLAVSAFVAERAAIQTGRPVPSVGQVIDRARFAAGDGGDRSEVLFVNPVPSKGFFLAVAIARAMPATRFRFQAAWSMPDAWWRMLSRTIADLPNVAIARNVDDMRPVYRRAAALLVPSVFEEAWGRVVTEAQWAGVPALAADRGALAEAVGEGGIVLPLHAPMGRWVAALDMLVADQGGRWSAAARRRADDPALDPMAAAARLLEALRAHPARSHRTSP